MARRILALALLMMAFSAGLIFWRGSSEPNVWRERPRPTRAENRARVQEVEDRLHLASKVAKVSLHTPTPRPLAVSAPSTEAENEPAANPSARQRRSDEVEQTLPRSSERPSVRLSIEELNALLQQRLLRWQTEHGDASIDVVDLWLSVEHDHFLLTTQLSTPEMDLLLGLPFELGVQRGRGLARLLGVRLGALPLPGADELPRLLRSLESPRLASLADQAELAVAGYPFDAVLDARGERVWIDSLRVEPNGVTIWLDPL